MYDEATSARQVVLTDLAGDAAANSVESEEESVVFPESVFEDREDGLNGLLHPFECLDSERQKGLQEPELANQKSQEC